jgi:hypothetical protein
MNGDSNFEFCKEKEKNKRYMRSKTRSREKKRKGIEIRRCKSSG